MQECIFSLIFTSKHAGGRCDGGACISAVSNSMDRGTSIFVLFLGMTVADKPFAGYVCHTAPK